MATADALKKLNTELIQRLKKAQLEAKVALRDYDRIVVDYARMHRLTRDNLVLVADLEKAEQGLQESSRGEEAERARAARLEGELGAKSAELKSLGGIFSRLKEVYTSQKKKVAEAERQLGTLAADITAKKEETVVFKATNLILEADCKVLKAENKALELAKQSAEAAKETAEAARSKAEANNAPLQQELARNRWSADTIGQQLTIATLRSELENCRRREKMATTESHEAEMANLQKNLTDALAKFDKLQHEVEEHEANYKYLQDSYEELEDQIADEKSKHDDTKTSLATEKESNGKKEKYIAHIETRLKDAGDKVEQQNEDVTSIQKRLDNAKAETKDAKEAVDGIKAQKEGLEREAEALRTMIQLSNAEREDLKRQIVTTQVALTAHAAKDEELIQSRATIILLEEAITRLNEDIALHGFKPNPTAYQAPGKPKSQATLDNEIVTTPSGVTKFSNSSSDEPTSSSSEDTSDFESEAESDDVRPEKIGSDPFTTPTRSSRRLRDRISALPSDLELFTESPTSIKSRKQSKSSNRVLSPLNGPTKTTIVNVPGPVVHVDHPWRWHYFELHFLILAVYWVSKPFTIISRFLRRKFHLPGQTVPEISLDPYPASAPTSPAESSLPTSPPAISSRMVEDAKLAESKTLPESPVSNRGQLPESPSSANDPNEDFSFIDPSVNTLGSPEKGHEIINTVEERTSEDDNGEQLHSGANPSAAQQPSVFDQAIYADDTSTTTNSPTLPPHHWTWQTISHPNPATLPSFIETLIGILFHFLIFGLFLIGYSAYHERKLWLAANDSTRTFLVNFLNDPRRYYEGINGILSIILSEDWRRSVEILQFKLARALDLQLTSPLPG